MLGRVGPAGGTRPPSAIPGSPAPQRCAGCSQARGGHDQDWSWRTVVVA